MVFKILFVCSVWGNGFVLVSVSEFGECRDPAEPPRAITWAVYSPCLICSLQQAIKFHIIILSSSLELFCQLQCVFEESIM